MMLKSVLEELRRNSDSEKSAVNAVCQTISDALSKTQENLLRDVDWWVCTNKKRSNPNIMYVHICEWTPVAKWMGR